jgi:uncharacterized membrane protein (Fun14 family)
MFNRLINSSKFQAMMLDVVIGLVTYFVTKYAAPSATEDVLLVIGILQVPFLAVILGTAYEDGQAKRAGLDPDPAMNVSD